MHIDTFFDTHIITYQSQSVLRVLNMPPFTTVSFKVYKMTLKTFCENLKTLENTYSLVAV